MEIDLIQPRHNYAPIEGLGQIYMPTSLLTAGARLLNAGVNVSFHDENLKFAKTSSDYVGFNLLGAPYIPEVIKLQEKIRREQGEKMFFVGGQVVSGLSVEQLGRLFGTSTNNGNDDLMLAKWLGIDPKRLLSPEQTSLIPAYERFDDETLRLYLSREFSLYVSQGCQKACSFCAADRTFKNPLSGVSRKVNERYRDIGIIQEDLDYLANKAESFGINRLDIYMSNLDVFQTPPLLLRFAYAVQEIKRAHPQIQINLRGLAIVTSFIEARDQFPKSIEELVKAGFNTVGFGVDGWGKEEWEALRKGHNTSEKCLEAIRSAREDFGITPEILMVFGNPKTTKKKNIKEAYEVTRMVAEKYGAIPRPHVSKDFIPGNEGWLLPEYASQVESLMRFPAAFQALDFTALPSSLTHPNKETRELATKYFLKICSLPVNTTRYVKPITPDLNEQEIEAIKRFNIGRYDH